MYRTQSPLEGVRFQIYSPRSQHLPNFEILWHPLYFILSLSAVWSLSIVPGAEEVSWDSFLIEG